MKKKKKNCIHNEWNATYLSPKKEIISSIHLQSYMYNARTSNTCVTIYLKFDVPNALLLRLETSNFN